MFRRLWKNGVSLLLALLMVISVLPMNVTADSSTATPTVEIVSFMRGSQTDLRSSELLEARVTGYVGNVRELTYEWTSTLGTYLYIYNSHNMYYIEGGGGEVEIYNSKIASSTNMAGRSYKDTFSGVGYCWASIYGSNTSGTGSAIQDYNAYNGTISVTVKDKDGNVIGSDSHTGKVTASGYGWWKQYTYSGIVDHKLQADMDDVTIGIFEGDKRNVKDLLGESAILHITCVESSVSQGEIKSGEDHIELTKESGDYYITGTTAGTSTSGDATVTLTVQKGNCKFHEKTSATATTTVYVFKKPTTDTTAYTLTLTDNLDSRCRYFIDGVEGKKQTDGTILFEGLKPNTEYMVEVMAEYTDENNNTRYTYAYVYDTTLPIYNGTVEVILNGTYDSETHTATGERVDISTVTPYNTIFAKTENSETFYELAKVEGETGIYKSVLDEGAYLLYYEADENTKIDDQHLTMHYADRTRYLFYNSVQYKDGSADLGTEYYVTGSSVAARPALTKEGYVFTGWEDENGNVYPADGVISNGIDSSYVLTAQWVEGIDVYLNIVIDHYDEDKLGHYTVDSDRHNFMLDLMHRPQGSTEHDFADVFPVTTTVEWNGESLFESELFEASRYLDDDTETDETHYTAKAPFLANTAPGSEYSVEIIKSGYEIVSLTSEEAENGDVTLNVRLRYNPQNADLKFSVELDDSAKELVENHPEYEPKEVAVKVLSWYSQDYTNGEHYLEANDWYHITQHHDTFVTLYMENGKAEGYYPVWMHNNSQTETYHYRIKVVSYVLADGTIVYTEDAKEDAKKNVEYITPDERYKATIYVDGGANPNESETSLEGAYFTSDGIQQGSLLGVISIDTHTVTLQPDGGAFSDGETSDRELTEQIEMPDLSQHIPTKDGGYVFDGWYVVDENGNITDELAQTADPLFDDITLRAKWREPLTVEGVIAVAGYYHLNGDSEDVRIIPAGERTHAVTVYLQKFLPNDYTETILEQKVDVSYSDIAVTSLDRPVGIAAYSFTGIPDDGTRYRVLLSNPNYITHYQNEPNSTDPALMIDYDSYDTSHFTAEFTDNEPLVADVNAFMEFEPHNFTLHYKVDASAIGESLRPENAEVLITCYDGLKGDHPQDWTVITQMDNGEVQTGQDTSIGVDGIGNGSYPVWRTKPDGHELYDYSVLLKDYTIDGEEKIIDLQEAPFYVYYNGSARYSAIAEPLDGYEDYSQTRLLEIALVPRRYQIVFEPNFTETEEDHITSFEKYTVSSGVYRANHVWSYETDISDAQPEREGYKFLGWYDEDGNLVTTVSAQLQEDIVLTAKWEKLVTVTFHSNNEDIEEDIFCIYYEQGNTPEGARTLNSDNTLDSFYGLPQFSYTDNNKYIFKGWYLDEDNDTDSRPISWNDVYTGYSRLCSLDRSGICSERRCRLKGSSLY